MNNVKNQKRSNCNSIASFSLLYIYVIYKYLNFEANYAYALYKQHMYCTFGKRSHAHTNKLMYSTNTLVYSLLYCLVYRLVYIK